MKIVRQNGNYAVFKEKTYRIDRSNLIYFLNKYPNNEWILWGNNEEFPIDKEKIESAYRLETIAEVDGFSMQIGNYVDGRYSLMPNQDKDAATYFGLEYDRSNGMYNAIWMKDEEIENIWEVRSPIEGFPYKTEKIVYLKMYGQWLDKPGYSVFP